jgi:hypothetical protein
MPTGGCLGFVGARHAVPALPSQPRLNLTAPAPPTHPRLNVAVPALPSLTFSPQSRRPALPSRPRLNLAVSTLASRSLLNPAASAPLNPAASVVAQHAAHRRCHSERSEESAFFHESRTPAFRRSSRLHTRKPLPSNPPKPAPEARHNLAQPAGLGLDDPPPHERRRRDTSPRNNPALQPPVPLVRTMAVLAP